MSWFAGRGLELQKELQDVVRRWSGIRCLVLVDEAGLPLASSLTSQGLEERLAALAVVARSLMLRSHDEIRTGAVHMLHLAAQDRQMVILPVDADTSLAAIVEADASIADVGRQLAATARHLVSGPWPSGPEPEDA